MADTSPTTTQQEEIEDPAIKEMIDAGVFYGRKHSRTHPRMKPFVLHNRNGIDIINLHKTAEGLSAATEFVIGKAKERAVFLVIATQPAFEDMVAQFTTDLSLPFVIRRWVGGTFTNFGIIAKRIDHLKKLKADKLSGALEKFTKKERLEIEREMERLQELLGGLENVSRVPDVVLVIDPNLHAAAIREARQLNVPVVALMNVDGDPDSIGYPVVGNTKSRHSVAWFLEKMRAAINDGVRVQPSIEPAPAVIAQE